MPEISILGWFHTIIAIVALLTGFYSLAVFKRITWQQQTGKVYLACTFIAAATALMIFRHGGFGPAHMLAVLTLLALIAGFVVTKIPFLSKIAVYFQTMCFSATILFHMIPAITDGLLRLPVSAPVLTDPHDPLLKKFYLAFAVIYLIGFVLQVLWIKRNNVTVE